MRAGPKAFILAGSGALEAWTFRHIIAPDGAYVKAGNGDNFRTDLAAGETFEVPPGFIGAYKGDLDDAANSLHQYWFNHSMPAILRNDAGYPKWDGTPLPRRAKAREAGLRWKAKYYPMIDDIAPLGFEEVVIDVNWWGPEVSLTGDKTRGQKACWPPAIMRIETACASDFTVTAILP